MTVPMRRTLCIIAAAGATALAAGSRPAPAEKWIPGLTPAMLALKNGSEIAIGAAVPLTGSLAGMGRHYRDAYEFTIERINASGGVTVGGKAYRLSLKVLDTKSS